MPENFAANEGGDQETSQSNRNTVNNYIGKSIHIFAQKDQVISTQNLKLTTVKFEIEKLITFYQMQQFKIFESNNSFCFVDNLSS